MYMGQSLNSPEPDMMTLPWLLSWPGDKSLHGGCVLGLSDAAVAHALRLPRM